MFGESTYYIEFTVIKAGQRQFKSMNLIKGWFCSWGEVWGFLKQEFQTDHIIITKTVKL